MMAITMTLTLSVTGLNAATKYFGAEHATEMSATPIATMLTRNHGRHRHSASVAAHMASSTTPRIGRKASGNPDAAIMAFSSMLGNMSFGNNPCQNQTNAMAQRVKA